MTHSIRLIKAKEAYPLRQMNLRPNLKVDECGFLNDDDPTTFHVGLFDGKQLLSIASFVKQAFEQFDKIIPDSTDAQKPAPISPSELIKNPGSANLPYRLRGMATHTAHHGQGLGAELVKFSFDELESRGCDLVWCFARIRAVPFYERLGFIIVGNTFEMPGIGEHKTMYKVLNPR